MTYAKLVVPAACGSVFTTPQSHSSASSRHPKAASHVSISSPSNCVMRRSICRASHARCWLLASSSTCCLNAQRALYVVGVALQLRVPAFLPAGGVRQLLWPTVLPAADQVSPEPSHRCHQCNIVAVYNSGTEVHVATRSELRQHLHQLH